MRSSHILLFSILFFILLLQPVYAVSLQMPGWSFAANILSMITGMPTSFFDTFPDFMFHFLLPFLLIWFICLGFMKQLRIFTRAPNWIDWFISFSMAALAVYPTGFLITIVTFFARFSGTVAILAYFGMFILGVVCYTFRWGSGQLGATRQIADLNKDEKKVRKHLDWVRTQYQTNTNPNSSTGKSQLKQIAKLEDELIAIQTKRKNLLEV